MKRSVSILLLVLPVAGIVACGRGHGNGSVNQLPTLELRYESNDIDNEPHLGFGIGPQGVVANPDRRDDGFALSIFDSTGKLVHRALRNGDGPGEIRPGVHATVLDSTVLLVDAFAGRAVRAALDGTPLATMRLSQDVFPRVAIARDTILGTALQEHSLPALLILPGGEAHALLAARDSFVLANFPASGFVTVGSGTQGVAMPVVGHWRDGFVLGDGWNYRLGFYSWDGTLLHALARDLPSPTLSEARIAKEVSEWMEMQSARGRTVSAADRASKHSEIAVERQPFFTHVHALGSDSAGRVWVLGNDADSAFADVFAADHFLGRIAVSCHGFDGRNWSMAGDWLALSCESDEPDYQGDRVFKVFQVVDP